MTRFEFLYLVISLVTTAVAIDMVRSWSGLLKRRATVRFYWVHAAWSVLIFLVVVQNWWTFWLYRVIEDWSFFAMSALIVNFLLMAMAVSVITPARRIGEPLDLESFFYENSPVFFSLIALLMCTLTVTKILIAGQALVSLDNVIRAVAISVAMLGATTRSTRVHSVLVGSSFVLLILFILLQVVR